MEITVANLQQKPTAAQTMEDIEDDIYGSDDNYGVPFDLDTSRSWSIEIERYAIVVV